VTAREPAVPLTAVHVRSDERCHLGQVCVFDRFSGQKITPELLEFAKEARRRGKLCMFHYGVVVEEVNRALEPKRCPHCGGRLP
jgi:hypothetical protein